MNRRGFSLVELLVVIVLIAMLMAVVLPGLVGSRKRSQSVLCQANLKQNATAALLFDQANGHFPYGFASQKGFSSHPPGGYLGDASSDWQGWWWLHQISDDGNPQQNTSLFCPSQKQADNLLCGHYGANAAILKNGDATRDSEFYGTPLGTARIRSAGRTLLLTDAGYALINRKVLLPAEHVRSDNPLRLASFYLPGLDTNVRRDINPDQRADALKGRHPGRALNVAFADGSVQSLKAAQLAATSPETGQTNRMFIWSP